MEKEQVVNRAEHTPGPWQAGLNLPGVANNNPDPCLVWSNSLLIVNCRSKWISWEGAKANARLIAAAPELLEALRECVTEDNASGMQPGLGRQLRRLKAINDIARAAIAKATGGAL